MNLIDVFMPEDLCARCAEQEAETKFSVTTEWQEKTVRLSFCSQACRQAFIDGYHAIKASGAALPE